MGHFKVKVRPIFMEIVTRAYAYAIVQLIFHCMYFRICLKWTIKSKVLAYKVLLFNIIKLGPVGRMGSVIPPETYPVVPPVEISSTSRKNRTNNKVSSSLLPLFDVL